MVTKRDNQVMTFSTEFKKPENRIMNIIKLRWRGLLFVASVTCLIFLVYYSVNKPKYSYNCQGPYWEDRSLKHLQRYCNSLGSQVTGEEGAVPHDSQYELNSVHMLIRHGDRYNMHVLPNYENHKVSCIISDELKEQVPVMTSYLETMKRLADEGGRTSSQSFHAYNLYPNKEACGTAQLTPTGAAQHVRNGQFLKRAYLDEWKLLDNTKLWDQVLIRCTLWSRTFQSSLAFMYGFLPELDLKQLQMEEASNNTMCTAASGMPCGCASIAKGIDLFSSNFQQRSPHVMAEPKLQDAYSQISEVLGVAANNLPSPSHIVDVSMIHYCHGLPLPNRQGSCMQPWAMGNVYDVVNNNGKAQVTHPTLQKVVRLKLQPLMHELSSRMQQQLKGETTLKFVLYSGHDSTVEPFAAAMGFSSGIWSRYAARIALELYTDPNNDGFLRVLHDGAPVTDKVSFCKNNIVDKKLNLCPIKYFIDFANGGNIKGLNEESYEKACDKEISFR